MDTDEWRWMRGHSVTLLPPVRGEAILRMHVGVPGELIARKPTITVKLNGRVVERFPVTGDSVERDFRVDPAPRGLPNVLELSIDRTVLRRSTSRASSDCACVTLHGDRADRRSARAVVHRFCAPPSALCPLNCDIHPPTYTYVETP